jgi:hypothetical protein
MAITILKEPNDLSFSKHPIYFWLRTNQLAQPNIRIFVKVKVYNETLATYQDVAPPLSLIPDSNGDAVFSIESLLDDYIQTFFPVVPDVITSMVCPQFVIEYAESFGEPAVIGTYVVSTAKWILRGGLNVGEYDTQKYFDAIPRCFLSTYSDSKKVAPNSIEYLYFLMQPANLIIRIRLKIVIQLLDGSEFIQYTDELSGDARRKVVRFSAGYHMLGLHTLYAPEIVKSYTCYVIDQNAQRVSQARFFEMDMSRCDSRKFVYENSRGGMDCLTATGKNVSEIDISKNFAQKYLPFNYAIQGSVMYNHGSKTTYNTSYSEMIKSSIGYKSCDEVDSLKDFLLSEKVWEYRIKEGVGKFFPVVVTTTKQPIYDEESRFEHTFQFDYQYAFDYPVLQLDLNSCKCCTCCDFVPMPEAIPPTELPPPPPPDPEIPPMQRLACNTTIGSAGFGVREWYVDLQSGGGVVNLDVDSLLYPIKVEIFHNGIRVATSGMSVANEGPFDLSDDDTNYPGVDQYINTSKGAIPNRSAAFLAANGYSQAVSFQQLIWFKYTAGDVLLDNRAIVRITNSDKDNTVNNYKFIQHCPT